jgi:hypothetical protein
MMTGAALMHAKLTTIKSNGKLISLPKLANKKKNFSGLWTLLRALMTIVLVGVCVSIIGMQLVRDSYLVKHLNHDGTNRRYRSMTNMRTFNGAGGEFIHDSATPHQDDNEYELHLVPQLPRQDSTFHLVNNDVIFSSQGIVILTSKMNRRR